jgi:hypothetical protein
MDAYIALQHNWWFMWKNGQFHSSTGCRWFSNYLYEQGALTFWSYGTTGQSTALWILYINISITLTSFGSYQSFQRTTLSGIISLTAISVWTHTNMSEIWWKKCIPFFSAEFHIEFNKNFTVPLCSLEKWWGTKCAVDLNISNMSFRMQNAICCIAYPKSQLPIVTHSTICPEYWSGKDGQPTWSLSLSLT